MNIDDGAMKGNSISQCFLLQNCQKKHNTKLTLDDLMIKPVQRIPRYSLLVKVRLFFLMLFICYCNHSCNRHIPGVHQSDGGNSY